MDNNYLIFDKYRDLKLIISSVIMIVFVSFLLFMILFFKFEYVKSYNGVVSLEDDYYVYILLDDSEIISIQNFQMVLDKKKLHYEIVKIDEEYNLTDYGPKKRVFLKFEIDSSKKVVNNIVRLDFISKKTFFERLKEKFI